MRLPPKSAIYVWDYNESGQTGRRGEEKSLRIPRKLPPELFGCPAAGGNSRWLDVACGRGHTAAVASDGSRFTWGRYQIIHEYMEMSCNSQRNLRMLGILPVDWYLGEVRKLAVGGGHSALLTVACSLKELCEFRLADSVTLSNASAIEDAASRTGSDDFVRLCGRFLDHFFNGGDCANDDDNDDDDEDDKFSLSM